MNEANIVPLLVGILGSVLAYFLNKPSNLSRIQKQATVLGVVIVGVFIVDIFRAYAPPEVNALLLRSCATALAWYELIWKNFFEKKVFTTESGLAGSPEEDAPREAGLEG